MVGRFSNRVSVALLCATVFIGAALPYAQTARFGFIGFDDDDYVRNNPLVQDGLTAGSVARAWGSVGYAANWHPLTWMSLMADVSLFGLNPGAMHLHNTVLHGLNAMLLFLLLCAMLTRRRPQSAPVSFCRLPVSDGQPYTLLFIAAFAALFWGAHPLRAEVVAWVTERKELLAGFWSLLTLLLHAEGVRRGRFGGWLYGGALACCFLALSAKPVAVSLPAVILAYEWSREGRVRWLRWAPFAALALGCCAMTLLAQREAMAPTELVGLSARLLNAVQAVGVYLRQTLWPAQLGCFYPLAQVVRFGYLALGCAAGVAAAASAVWAVWQVATGRLSGLSRAAPALTGGVWFLAGLLPMLGIVQVGSQAHADRYTYWPGCGLSVVLAWLVLLVLGRYGASNRPQLPSAARRCLGSSAAACMLGLIWVGILTGLAWRQAGFWKDTLTLFTHTYEVTENNGWAACSLGDAYARMGRFEEAETFYRQSIAIRPNEENLAALAIFKATRVTDGNFDEAYDLANRALAQKADDPTANEAMGLIALRVGAWQPAEEHLAKSMRRKVGNPVALEWLGMAQFNQKKYTQACESYARALAFRPGDPKLQAKYDQSRRAAAPAGEGPQVGPLVRRGRESGK